MKLKSIHILVAFVLLFSCDTKQEIDKEKPVIRNDFAEAFPLNCDTLYFGESFLLTVQFTDNVELGSYSIDIHNNFDHHSHSTEVTACDMDEKKDAVNPFVFIDEFDIPEGLSFYQTALSISIPTGNSEGDYDEGDYHFFISLTDKGGWSAQMGLSVKILRRG